MINIAVSSSIIINYFSEAFPAICPTNGGAEVFVHASGLSENIAQNDAVRYYIQEGRRVPNAVNAAAA